jgi:hypothetical protein
VTFESCLGVRRIGFVIRVPNWIAGRQLRSFTDLETRQDPQLNPEGRVELSRPFLLFNVENVYLSWCSRFFPALLVVGCPS